MQQFLKPAARVAWARIIPTQLLEEFLFAADNAFAAFNSGFGRESLPALTRVLETRTGRGAASSFPWHTSVYNRLIRRGADDSCIVPFRGLTSPSAAGYEPVKSDSTLSFPGPLQRVAGSRLVTVQQIRGISNDK